MNCMSPSDTLYSRTALLLTDAGLERLKQARVLVVGLGGVGGYAAEMLCRSGVGHLTLVDADTVSPSNINRQVIAMQSTVGQPKAELFKQRLADINPDCKVVTFQEYLRDERTEELLNTGRFDYVVDAIDTLSPKVYLLYNCHKMHIPVVSSMGSAGKLDPMKISISDISKSHTCPLAAMVRKRLRRLGVTSGITVVFSTEEVPRHAMFEELSENKRTTIGTVSYLPPLFGCCCASVVIRSLVDIPVSSTP